VTDRAEVAALALAHREAAQFVLFRGRLDVYKVRGKVFGICSDRDGLSFKATPIAFAVLTDGGPGRPAPGFPKGKGTWVNMPLGEISRADAADWLATSYRLAAGTLTKAARAELGVI